MNPITVRKILRALRICRREPAAHGLPGRVGRRRPAPPARALPAGRRDLPGHHRAVGGRHPHRLAGLRQLDRRRRLPAGHQRLRRHGRPAGQGVPRRHAAGEDGHRRGRRRGGAGRRRDALARVSGVSDYFAVDEHDAIRLGRQIVAGLTYRKLGPPPDRGRRAAPLRPRRDPGHRLGRPQGAVPGPRGAGPGGGRLRARRVQAQLRAQPGHRLRPSPRLLGRHPGQRPRVSCSTRTPTRRPSSSSWPTRSTRRCCSSRTSPATWSAPSTSSGAWSSTAPTRSTPSPTARCRT